MAAPSTAPSTTATAPPGQPGQPRRSLWRSVTEFSARTPLRVKLIAALLTLVIAALISITVAGAFEFRGYLHSNADQQVTSLLRDANAQLSRGGINPNGSVNCPGPFVEAFVLSGETMTGCQSASGATTPVPNIPTSPSWLKNHSGQLVTLPATFGGGSWRVITSQVTFQTFGGAVTGTLVAGEDLGNLNQAIGRLVSIDLIVGAIVVLGLAIVGVAVIRASLQPLTEIEQTAGEIAAGDLTRRVTERDPSTEVGSLGRSLNVMLAQIEAAFRAQARSEATARQSEARMRQFAADASHELRTPLTAIKGFAEYYRQRGGLAVTGEGKLTSEELDRIMNRVEDEATRMGGLVEDLLLLARIDQQRPLERRPVDLLALAADAVQDARMIAPAREIGLTVGRGTAFLVMGDEGRLRQVVGNLMSNALNHTPDGTPVEVHVRSGTLPGWGPAAAGGGPANQLIPAVVLEVVDHGPGMSADQAQRVFERFYRADAARTRNRATGGTGLGLAIVSALVSAHGGAVFLDTAPGKGATFRVTLPLAPEAQGDGMEDPGHQPDEEEGWETRSSAGGQALGGQAPGGEVPGGQGGSVSSVVQSPPGARGEAGAAAAGEAGRPGVGEDASPGAGEGGWRGAGEGGWRGADRPGSPGQRPEIVERRPWRPFS
jgi:two-component system, OmpR family, sensor kinase